MELLVLAAVLVISLLLIPLGLPGLWLMIAAALGYDMLGGVERIGWVTLAIATVLAGIAEAIEFGLAARYTRKYGGSRRAGWGAILGGLAGAFVGVPVPVIGSVIGAFVGSFVGALVFEGSRERNHGTATRVAWGALIGRVAATAAKTAIGVGIAAILLWAAWL